MSEDPEQSYGGGGRYEAPDTFESAQEYAKLDVEFPRSIEVTDIHAHAIAPGETEIVAQRHGDYVRPREDASRGSLTGESASEVGQTAKAYFETFMNQIPENERGSVDVLFVASDTQYFSGGRRSLETGSLAQQAAEEVFQQMGIPLENIHNNRGELHGLDDNSGPRTMPAMREPNFLNTHPEFVDYLVNKYSQTTDDSGRKVIDTPFWIAFETDAEKELREQVGAEGPDCIADRMEHSINVLGRYAQAYHKLNPDRRLVIWAATHYDTISPYVRRDIFEQEDYKDQSLGVKLGGGITIDVDKEGNATTEIGGTNYDVPLRTSGKRPQPES